VKSSETRIAYVFKKKKKISHGFGIDEEIKQRWRQMIDCARDPRGYALWQVPV
jgi:hypothetical protein